ncbi:MAG TPA: FAD-dependent oxidoreductase [Polyangiaceae bacterium]|nr:FAD-dependent oxidoreductase [Polyangiaceae bacterium]
MTIPALVASKVGSAERPLRVAVVGSGPAGFYAAEWLFREKQLHVEVDLFERLPAPFGLVRYGVAPDHQRIKRVELAFERTAAHAGFRLLGNVEVARDVTPAELSEHYDQVLYTYGSATDRRLDIPGEDLAGSEPATAFVGWYNAHPDFYERSFDLSSERAVVVGMGNVAMDVARILARRVEELATTDMPEYALQALRASRIREVVLLGRRGPAQAAFDQHELEDIATLEDVSLSVHDPDSLFDVDVAELSPAAKRNVTYLKLLAERPLQVRARHVVLRFLASPVELIGDGGRVSAVKIEKNALKRRGDGSYGAHGTGQYETLPSGLVLRSIGYHGVPLGDLPFASQHGIIPNVGGRVTQDTGGAVLPFVYVAGWIKRGPTGLIGTNKDDAKHTVEHMLADLPQLPAQKPARGAIDTLLGARGVRVVSYDDFRKLDALEVGAGKAHGKVREKFCSVAAMLEALAREPP